MPYGQKGVDDRSKWRAGSMETEVGLDGWCEGGLWATEEWLWRLRERSERVESPGTYVTE